MIRKVLNEMAKVPFDGKNCCPDDIVDQLTGGWATYKDNMATGFIDDIPAVFTWSQYEMKISFISKDDINDCFPRLEEYVGDMRTEQPEWIVMWSLDKFTFKISLYDKDED